MEKTAPEVSVVIPVYNEEESLPGLFERLLPVMEGLDRSWEVVFVNDGSRDRSLALLLDCVDKHPGAVRVVDFNGTSDSTWPSWPDSPYQEATPS